MQRADSLGKTLMLGKIEGRRRGQQRLRWLDDITDAVDMSLNKPRRWWRTGKPSVLQSMGSQRVGHDWQLNNKFVIAFLPRSKHLLISWLQSPSTVISEPRKIKSVPVSNFSHLFAKKWWDQMPWSLFFECWFLSQFFYSPLSPAPRGSLIPLCFLPLWGGKNAK